MRILSLNLSATIFLALRESRLEPFFELVRSRPVDQIHLQEVTSYSTLLWLRAKLPQRYFVHFSPGIYGPKGGLVTLSFHPGTSAFSRAARDPMNPMRSSGILSTAYRDGGASLNVHLCPDRTGTWISDGYVLRKHVELVCIEKVLNSTSPSSCVVAGDFNMPRDHEMLRDFIRNSGLVDAFRDVPAVPTFHKEYLPEERRAHAIDQIMLRIQGDSVVRARTVFLEPGPRGYVSDHAGLLVDVD